MAYPVSYHPANSKLPVFFNIDGAVGDPPCPNKREDVLFVQFALTVIGGSPNANDSPALIDACKKVSVTGVIDDATEFAVCQLQVLNRGAVVDGRVTPAQGYDYGTALYSIVDLNRSIQNRNKDVWPRLDMIAGCPQELAAMVKKKLVGQ